MVTGQAVIVGGTKGLGREVAERFLARGHAVTVVSRQRPAALKNDPRLRHVAVDLETLRDASAVVIPAVSGAGPIQYLVFCQRYRGEGDPWQGEFQVSLTATRILVEGFSDHFVFEGDRAIGIVSSVYAEFVGGSQPIGYHVVKAGLNQLTRYYACELGRRGIRVNGIMPLTYIKDESRNFYNSKPELAELYNRLVPLGRMGESRDSADLLDFLCSERAAFINGQCIFVDGGVSAIWQEELAKRMTGV